MVVLLLSMTTMLSVEVQTAGHTHKIARAKQNAILALNVAIAELQRTTGPDQRVTAPANLQLTDSAISPHWIGVYAHALTPSYELIPGNIADELTDSTLVNSQGSSAKLLTWLVSGNAPNNSWPEFQPTGQLADPSVNVELSFTPDASISNLSQDSPANASDIQIQDANGANHPGRILVGGGAVHDLEDYVVAPMVTLESEPNDSMINSYAWWVSDENVKARANLAIETDPNSISNAFISSSRNAIELMSQGASDGALDEPRIDELYDPSGGVERALGLGDLAMLSTDPSNFSLIEKRRFHDISLHSTSLLTDSFAGGLKRDLSTLLDDTYTPSANDPTVDSNRLWTPHQEDTTGYGIPTWGHLRSFAHTRVPNSRTLDAQLPVFDKLISDDHVGVSPILTYFSLGMGFSASGVNSGADIEMNLYPLVVLWNPYNFTIKAPSYDAHGANYEVGMLLSLSLEAKIGIDIFDPGSVTQGEGAETVTEEYIWRNIGNIDLRKNIEKSLDDPNDKDFEYIRFSLDCPDIPPGQSLIFSIPHSDRGKAYDSHVVLKNIEPEPDAFVSLPVATLDKDFTATTLFRVGPRFSVNSEGVPTTSLSATLLSGGDGGLFTYLGMPREDRTVAYSKDNAMDFNPSNPDLSWYQTQQSITWDNAIVQDMPNESVLVQVTEGGKKVDRIFKPEEINGGNPISAIQTPATLSSDPSISYVIMTHALFSGGGNNAQYNANQFMFPTRWIAQGSMRATRTGRTRRDQNYLPLYIATAGSEGNSSAWQKFANDEGSESNRTSAGSGHDWGSSGPVDVTLFEFLPEDQPLLSIGQLQHANLSLIGAYPSYPIGNSLADYRLHEKSPSGAILPPSQYELARTDSVSGNTLLKADQIAYYDISFLLNRTLWDAYFVSSVPQNGNLPDKLPNSRMSHTGNEANLRDPDKAAAELSLVGGFNINSTSEQAWRAILGGDRGLQYNPETGNYSTNQSLQAAFPRFARPTADDSWVDPWEGYRSLTDEETAQLARNIVTEIKNRGPFISLSDFINRRLVDNPSTDDSGVEDAPYEHEDLRGVIQAALDRTWSSTDPDSKANGDSAAYPANDGADDFWKDDPLLGHPYNNTKHQFGSGSKYVYNLQRMQGGDTERSPYSNRSAFSPKYVTQADVLSTIGASLTARSDTFTIRAYGEVTSAFTSNDRVGAWCEAVVQRTAEYVDNQTDNPEDRPTSVVNQHFGRRYKLISFRWLEPSEI
ncbi:hypothetical protein [Cerasicoccus arenae]|nr:hypothetical protein [Cerasicoccus arenae]MBK1857639.1 hypothetical protein [Cerasicoccus arenae]